MLTTGNDTLDAVYRKQSSINSTHKVIAEWNQNSYSPIENVGCYPVYLNVSSEDPAYSKSYDVNPVTGGWDNGGYYNEYKKSGTNKYLEDKNKKELSNLMESFYPNRPDPGIIYGYGLPQINNSIVNDSRTLRAYNLLDSKTRLYPLNKNQGFKYWISPRYPKPNISVSPPIPYSFIGVADANGKITGNNAFVVYQDGRYSNKITVKTQVVNGFSLDWTIELLIGTNPSWVIAYQENAAKRTQTGNSTPTMLDGIVRLKANRNNNGVISWTLAGGVETEATITSLHEDDIEPSVNYKGLDAQLIKGIRFSVQKMSSNETGYPALSGATLDLIEISPRLVVDMTPYTSSFDISTSMGDAALGIPTGSIVSSNGSVTFLNDENIISNGNPFSILYGMLKPNVKFTFLNVVKNNANTVVGYVPVKVMYSTTWDEGSGWEVKVQLEDYMKFLKEQKSPDVLIGARDGVRSSSIIKILLDNAGFTKFSFKKTSNYSEHIHEDIKVDYFYSSKENTVAEILNEIAKSTQMSIYFDNTNTLIAITKEAAAQKRPAISGGAVSTFDYWLVGDATSIKDSEIEYPYIYDEMLGSYKYISNIESFDDTRIPPITSGDVSYQSLGLNKQSLYATRLELSQSELSDITSFNKIKDAGFGELTLNRNISYVPQTLWEAAPDSGESQLFCGKLIKTINNLDPYDLLISKTFQAVDKIDAIKLAYNELKLIPSQLDSIQIPISEEDFAYITQQKYNGYVVINSETIKYNGILFTITGNGFSTYQKIYFSLQEIQNDKSKADNGSNFIPYALIVDLDMQIVDEESPTIEGNKTKYTYSCKRSGRGFKDTEVQSHIAQIDSGSRGWSSFVTKVYDSTQPSLTKVRPTLSFISDSKVASFNNILNGETEKLTAGFARLVGPSSGDTGTSQKITAITIGSPSTGINKITSILNPSAGDTVFLTGVCTSSNPSGALSTNTNANHNQDYIVLGTDPADPTTNPAPTPTEFYIGSPITDVPTSLNFANVTDKLPATTQAKNQTEIYIDSSGQQFITGVKKSVGFYPDKIGTTMRIIDQLDKNSESFIGGLGFFLSGSDSGIKGYFLELTTAEQSYIPGQLASSNVILYRLNTVGGVIVATRIGAASRLIASSSSESSASTYFSTLEIDKASWQVVSDVDVSTSLEGSRRRFEIIIGNDTTNKITMYDSTPLAPTEFVGLFVRDDSEIIYENIYAVSLGNTAPANIYDSSYMEKLRDSINRGYSSKSVIESLSENSLVYYEDYTTLVREARPYNVRFKNPAFLSKLIDLTNIVPDYKVKEYSSTAFGATFWIYNTSKSTIGILGEGSIPLFISGYPLLSFSDNSIKIDEYLDFLGANEKMKESLRINKNIYGEQSVNITGLYINNYDEAKNLAEWIANHSSKEKLSLSVSIFPNPLLQIGDVVKIYYKARGYSIDSSGEDKSFIISEISYSVTSDGIDMTLGLREMI